MKHFEDELRAALRPEQPAPDFAARVLERIAQLPAPEKKREKLGWRQRIAEFFQPPQLKWAMAGAMALLLVGLMIGGYRYREQQRRQAEIAEGERAKEQVMLAMRIASHKLNVAQKKVQQTGERAPDEKQDSRQ
jgi:hypothetical protein